MKNKRFTYRQIRERLMRMMWEAYRNGHRVDKIDALLDQLDAEKHVRCKRADYPQDGDIDDIGIGDIGYP